MKTRLLIAGLASSAVLLGCAYPYPRSNAWNGCAYGECTLKVTVSPTDFGRCFSEIDFPILYSYPGAGGTLYWEFAHGTVAKSSFTADGIKFVDPNAPFKCESIENGNRFKCTKVPDAKKGTWHYAVNAAADGKACSSYDPIMIND